MNRDSLIGTSLLTGSILVNAFLQYYRSSCINSEKISIVEAVAAIESRIQRDEGKRGIQSIVLPAGELLDASIEMLRADNVVIITGFPCLMDYSPPTETDGPLGALSLAKTLLLMGKSVMILTDECNDEVILACSTSAGIEPHHRNRFFLQSFPPAEKFDEKDMQRFTEVISWVDLVIAIERAGPNRDGKYFTMRCKDMSHLIAPLDRLLTVNPSAINQSTAEDEDGNNNHISKYLQTKIRSIGIGDGGNEVGMGKVYNSILKSSIPNAAEIGCVVAADHLIVSSVSNWGGYALSAATGAVFAIFLTQRAKDKTTALDELKTIDFESFRAYLKTATIRREDLAEAFNYFLPTRDEEVAKCKSIVSAGARDGITAQLELMVDGMSITESLAVIEDIKRTAWTLRL